jgi:hypothetical protein
MCARVRACVRVISFTEYLANKNLKLKIARMFLFVVHAPTGDILSGFSDTLYPFLLRHVHVRIAPRLRHFRPSFREGARAFLNFSFLFRTRGEGLGPGSKPSLAAPSKANIHWQHRRRQTFIGTINSSGASGSLIVASELASSDVTPRTSSRALQDWANAG